MSPDGGNLLLCHGGVIEIRARWDGLATGIVRNLCAAGFSDPHGVAEAVPVPRFSPRRALPLVGISQGGRVRLVESPPSRPCSISRWTADSRHIITLLAGPGDNAVAPTAALFIHDSHGNELAALSTAWTHVTPAAASGAAAGSVTASTSASSPAPAPPLAEDVRDALALWHCLAPAGGICDVCVVDSFTFASVDRAAPLQRAAATLAILGDDGFLRLVAVSWGTSPSAVAWSHAVDVAGLSDADNRRAVPWLKLTALGVHSLAGVVDVPSCMALAQWPPVTPSRASRAALPAGDGMLPSTVVLLAVGGSLSSSLQSLQPRQPPSSDAQQQNSQVQQVHPSAAPGVILLRLELPRLCVGVFCGEGDLSRLPDSGVGVLGWHTLSEAGTGMLPPSADFIVRSLPGDAADEVPRPVFGTSFAHKNLALLGRLPPPPPGYDRAARLCGPQQQWTGTDAGPDGRWSAMCCAPCSLAYRFGATVASSAYRCCRRGRTVGDALGNLPRLAVGEHHVAAVLGSDDAGVSDDGEDRVAAVRAALPVVPTGLLFQGVDPAAGDAARSSLPLLAVLDSRQRLVLWHLWSLSPALKAAAASPRRQREGGEDDYDEVLATADRLHVAAELSLCRDAGVRGAQWYALDCLAVACTDQTLHFFALDAPVDGSSRKNSLTASPLSVWRRSGASRSGGALRWAVAGAGDGGGILVLSLDDGDRAASARHAAGIDSCEHHLVLSTARLTNMQELEESGGAGADSELTSPLTGDVDHDLQRVAAYWRHVASGVSMSMSVLEGCVLSLSLSQRGSCFALAVAVQGGILAQLLFFASRFESRAGFALAAAGSAVPPTDLSTARLLLLAGLVALQELMESSPPRSPNAQHVTPTIATRVHDAVSPTELLAVAVHARAAAHALAASAAPEQLAGLLVPVQVLVLCAGLLAGRARRLVQYFALRDALAGAAIPLSAALFFECSSASAVDATSSEDCAALEFRWFSGASGTELIRACLLPREVCAWARRAAISTAPGATLVVAPRILAPTPQALLVRVLTAVPSARAIFIEVFFAAWELFHLRSSVDVEEGLSLLLLCDEVPGDATDFGVHPASLLSVFSPDDPEFSLFVATHLALLVELEVSAVREARCKGDAPSAQRVLTSSRAALATLCLENGTGLFARSTSQTPNYPVVPVLQWIATTLSSVAGADRALLSRFSCSCTLVSPQDRPALLGGVLNLAADLRVVESIARAFSACDPMLTERALPSPPTLRQWFDASVLARAGMIAALSTAYDTASASAAWSDELLPALDKLGDSALCWSVLDALTRIVAASASQRSTPGERDALSEASTRASSLSALRLLCDILPAMVDVLSPEPPARIDASALLRTLALSIVGCPYLIATTADHRAAASKLLDVGLSVLSDLGTPSERATSVLRVVVDASAVLAKFTGSMGDCSIPAWQSLSTLGVQIMHDMFDAQRSPAFDAIASPLNGSLVVPLALVAAVGSDSHAAAETLLETLLDAGPSRLAIARAGDALPGDVVTVIGDVFLLLQLMHSRPFSGAGGVVPVVLQSLLRSLRASTTVAGQQAALSALRALLVACSRRGEAQLPAAERWVSRGLSHSEQLSSTEAELATELAACLSKSEVLIPPPSDIVASLAKGAAALVSCHDQSAPGRQRADAAIASRAMGAARLLSAFVDVESVASGVYALSAHSELQGLRDWSVERGYLAGALALLAPPLDSAISDLDASRAVDVLDWVSALPKSADSEAQQRGAPQFARSRPFDSCDLHPLWRPWYSRLPPVADEDIAECDAATTVTADCNAVDYDHLLRGCVPSQDSDVPTSPGLEDASSDSAVARLLSEVGDLAETVVSVAAGAESGDHVKVGADSILAAGHALTSMFRRVPGAVLAVSGAVAQETAASAAQTAMSVLARTVNRSTEFMHGSSHAATDNVVADANDATPLLQSKLPPARLSTHPPGGVELSASVPATRRHAMTVALLETFKNLAAFHDAVVAVESRLWAAGLFPRPLRSGEFPDSGVFKIDPSVLLTRLRAHGDGELFEDDAAADLEACSLGMRASPVLWTAWRRSNHAECCELPRAAKLCARLAASGHLFRGAFVRALRDAAFESCASGATGLAALLFLSAFNADPDGPPPSTSALEPANVANARVALVRLSLAVASASSRSPLTRIGSSLFAVTESSSELARAGNSLIAALMRGGGSVTFVQRESFVDLLRRRLADMREDASNAALDEAESAAHGVLCRGSSLPMTTDSVGALLQTSSCAAIPGASSNACEALTLSIQAGLIAGILASDGVTLGCDTDVTADVYQSTAAVWAPDLRSESFWPATMFASALALIRGDVVVGVHCALVMWATASTAAFAACERNPSVVYACAEALDRIFEHCYVLLQVGGRGAPPASSHAAVILRDTCAVLPYLSEAVALRIVVLRAARRLASAFGFSRLEAAFEAMTTAADVALSSDCPELLPPLLLLLRSDLARPDSGTAVSTDDSLVALRSTCAAVAAQLLSAGSVHRVELPSCDEVPYFIALATTALPAEAPVSTWPRDREVSRAASLVFALVSRTALDRIPAIISALPALDAAWQRWCNFEHAEVICIPSISACLVAEAAVYAHLERIAATPFDEQHALMMAALVCRLREPVALERFAAALSRWGGGMPSLGPTAWLVGLGGPASSLSLSAFHPAVFRESTNASRWLRAALTSLRDAASSLVSDTLQADASPRVNAVLCSALLELALLDLEDVRGLTSSDRLLPIPVGDASTRVLLPSAQAARSLSKQCLKDIRDLVTRPATSISLEETPGHASSCFLAEVGALDNISSVSRLVGTENAGATPASDVGALLQCLRGQGQPLELRAVHALKSLFFRLLSESLVARVGRFAGVPLSAFSTEAAPLADNAVDAILITITRSGRGEAGEHAQALGTFLALLCRDYSRLVESSRRLWRSLPWVTDWDEPSLISFSGAGAAVCADLLSGLLRLGLGGLDGPLELELLCISAAFSIASSLAERGIQDGTARERVEYLATLRPARVDLSSSDSRISWFRHALSQAGRGLSGDDGSEARDARSVQHAAHGLQTFIFLLASILAVWMGLRPHTYTLPSRRLAPTGTASAAVDEQLGASDALLCSTSQTSSIMAQSALAMLVKKTRGVWDAEAVAMLAERVRVSLSSTASAQPGACTPSLAGLSREHAAGLVCALVSTVVSACLALLEAAQDASASESGAISLSSVVVDLGALVRPGFANAVDAACVLPPDTPPSLGAQWLGTWDSRLVSMTEDEELLVFSTLAQLCLHRALSAPRSAEVKGQLASVAALFGLESHYAVVKAEAIALLARVHAKPSQPCVAIAGVLRLVCTSSPLVLPAWLVTTMRQSRSRAAVPCSWRDVTPFAHVYASGALQAWRRVVALGVRGTPFPSTLPFLVAAMASMGALEEALLASDIDPSWARPASAPSGVAATRAPTSCAASVKAYLLFCFRALGTLRVAFQSGSPAEVREFGQDMRCFHSAYNPSRVGHGAAPRPGAALGLAIG